MPQENIRDVCSRGSKCFSVDLSILDDQIFSALHFDYGSEDGCKALQVVDSNLCKGTHTTIVIPRSPGRACIPIQSASAVHPANRAIMNSSPKSPKGWRQLHKCLAHQVHATILGAPAKLFGFATRCRGWLFDDDVLSVLQRESY